jgi:hypothetical protein
VTGKTTKSKVAKAIPAIKQKVEERQRKVVFTRAREQRQPRAITRERQRRMREVRERRTAPEPDQDMKENHDDHDDHEQHHHQRQQLQRQQHMVEHPFEPTSPVANQDDFFVMDDEDDVQFVKSFERVLSGISYSPLELVVCTHVFRQSLSRMTLPC